MASCSNAIDNFHHDLNLKIRHSFYGGETVNGSHHSRASWKSDMDVAESVSKAEYYKRYEHDEIPVKDDSSRLTHNIEPLEPNDSEIASLTNSDLEKLENKIYKNISQELQTDEPSITSLESNIKFFKTTVQEIFDNFYTIMQDFELYKKRFEDILAKNREDAVGDMEDFIKDMIQHIMSSESCLPAENRKLMEATKRSSATPEKETAKLLESLHSVVKAYKNEDYFTDSTFDDKLSKSKQTNSSNKEDRLNIYLLSGTPCVEIKMNDRNLLSEINIKDLARKETEYHVASAENIKRLTAKKLELEEYVRQEQGSQAQDREIPVKVSFAKKNIYLNEDFAHDRDKDDNKSLMSKICSYICKKFRKV